MSDPTPERAQRGGRARLLRLGLAGLLTALGVISGLLWLRQAGVSAALAQGVKRQKLAAAELRMEALGAPYDALKQLAIPLGPPQPREWLAEHAERGQRLAEYLVSSPRRPTPTRRTLYLQPIGDLDATQTRLIADTARFVEAFFSLPVKVLPELPLEGVPAKARRVHPRFGMKQLLTPWLLHELLTPRLPADGMALLGLTAVDLYPAPDWNFVFGQASYREGVGVWSIARFGDPSASESAYRETLEHTLATATHELFHMFSAPHCVAWECLENGSNSLKEAEGRPIHLCPACLAKLCFATGCNLPARLAKLAALTKTLGLAREATYYQRALARIEKSKSSPEGPKDNSAR